MRRVFRVLVCMMLCVGLTSSSVFSGTVRVLAAEAEAGDAGQTRGLLDLLMGLAGDGDLSDEDKDKADKAEGYIGGLQTILELIEDSQKTGKNKNKHLAVTVSTKSYEYNGKTRKPTVRVTAKGEKLTASQYTVTYKNNKDVGKATVIVKGKGDYKGWSGSASFKITLKKTVVASVKASGTSITVKWKKDSQAKGYQVQYSTNKSFSGSVKKKVIRTGTTTSCTIDGLEAGKKYYVRIRSTKSVSGSAWYSQWSGAKTVTISKSAK